MVFLNGRIYVMEEMVLGHVFVTEVDGELHFIDFLTRLAGKVLRVAKIDCIDFYVAFLNMIKSSAN